MAQFGGTTQYGGAAQFGGGEARTEIYYRIAKSVLEPLPVSLVDEDLYAILLRTDCKLVGDVAKVHIDRVFAEIFPHTAAETQNDWAKLLGVIFRDGDKQDDRRARLVSKWRGAGGPSLDAIREALAEDLNADTHFYDDFENLDISPRYDTDGANEANNGTIVEVLDGSDGGVLTITAPSPTDCSWAGGTVNAPRIGLNLLKEGREGADDVEARCLFRFGASTAADSKTGIVFWQDDDNALFFVVSNGLYRVDRLVEGSLTVGTVTVAVPAPAGDGHFMRFGRFSGQWEARYAVGSATASGPGSFTLLEQVGNPSGFKPRFVGLTSINAGAFPLGRNRYMNFHVAYGKAKNNVEIVEFPLALIDPPLSGGAFPEQKFTFFVHRLPFDPFDIGAPFDNAAYDIRAAQRTLDRIKQAHTLGTVGEQDDFLTDDPESLTDRDILGF